MEITTTPAELATRAQRRRSAALVVAMVALVALGAASRLSLGRAPGTVDAHPWLAGGRLDINRATQRELEAIPGIGAGLARAIVEERARRGGFRELAELDDVDGVGPATLEKLRAYVDVR